MEKRRAPEIKDILSSLMLGLQSEMVIYNISKYVTLFLDVAAPVCNLQHLIGNL